MTDKEKLKALLDEWEVPYTEDLNEYSDENTSEITVERTMRSQKVGGYNGFFTVFSFDAEGRFECMGAWE